ncbi:related to glucan 1,3-beta-glucosidase [Rhynchosporium secalis]|uniref:glucan 1,3-beta-glucosidase n=1 Tax=Rhynchosporium secalis TaxID=38038 RepID=A0A1E1MMX5_RHYSE|nr:related to glucan 1,3-beta-glucosidase [Rhynchosporium secalis]
MFSAASSTERLDATGVNSEKNYGVRKKPRALWLWTAGVVAVLAIAAIVVGALIGTNVIDLHSKSTATSADAAQDPGSSSTTSTSASGKSGSSTSTSPSTSSKTAPTPMITPAPPVKCTKPGDIPTKAKGTWLDPTSWLDMTGFNCTFTDATVGGLPIVGLNSTWDNSKLANPNVPPLSQPWGSYKDKPFRGVSIGGWLALEPFITPSLFEDDSTLKDEYRLCAKLGPQKATAVLEKHYATFITEDDFKAIAAAGLDHVRIPFSYWAVKTYEGDPYVSQVSWRYLLRGIEWARKYGLRVKIDLHAVPGSQNGWNHSGHDGKVNWITGPDGALNAQRTLDIHDQLSKFFAQDRFKNIVAFYGLVNEPAMTIPMDDLIAWTQKAYKIVHDNGVDAVQVFSESMRGLEPWAGKLTGFGDSLALDVHEYTIFDNALLQFSHTKRIEFACGGWVDQLKGGLNPSTGFGPTMVGEWSQADTDCAKYLNGVNNGARWVGKFMKGSPACPTQDGQCSCEMANAPSSTFSKEYKVFLQTWAEAQMSTFELSWGWFYWTWKTESTPLWDYQAGLKGGYMPAVAYQRSWNCSQPVPSLGNLPEFY